MRSIKKSSKNAKERVYTVVRGSTKIVIELFRSPRKSWKLACATSPEISSQKPSLLHQAWPQEHDNVLKLVQVNENKDPVFAAAAWPSRVQNFPSFLIVQMKMGPKTWRPETMSYSIVKYLGWFHLPASQRQGSNVLQGGVSG